MTTNSDQLTLDSPDLAFKTSRFHRLLWRELEEDDRDVQRISRLGRTRRPDFQQFARETFARMFNPRTKPVEQPVDWAQKLHDQANTLPEFQALQQRVAGQQGPSSRAAVKICDKLIPAMKPRQSNVDPERLAKRVRTLEQMGASGVDVKARLEEAQRALQEAQGEAEALAAGLDPRLTREAIREGVRAAERELDEEQSAVSVFTYGDQAGIANSRADYKVKRQIADRVRTNPKLKQIADRAGRLKRIAAEKQRQKSNYARSEIQGVAVGDDIERMLPSEMLALADPDTEILLMSKVAEKTMGQYHLAGVETKGRGPIIMCQDESGSMSGSEDTWAKAVSLALLEIATMQKRLWSLIHFDSCVHRLDIYRPALDEGETRNRSAFTPMPWTQPSASHIADAMVHFSGGGTSFEEPIRKAVELIAERGEMKKADIIIVTDGCGSVGPEFARWFKREQKRLEFTLYAVVVGHYTDVLTDLTNYIFKMSDILSNDSAFNDQVFSM
jgi:uncharacterized protein with von Willebrand factor type A (vWA) domain